MDQNYFRRLISGEDKSGRARFIMAVFCLLSFAYKLIICIRNKLYDFNICKSHPVDAKVISIGNITAGGTGKTPIVMWLCKYLESKGIQAAVISRGYKSRSGMIGDEAAMMSKNFQTTKVISNSDRIQGALKAINTYNCSSVVLDDGFQHRRIKRDLDILAIDATCPFGFNRMLPSGLLREPLSGIKRAQAIIITRTDLSDENKLVEIENRLKKINPSLVIARSEHSPTAAKMLKDKTIDIDTLKDRKVFAFCGIGNPDGFTGSLKNAGLNVVGHKFFNDHEHYTYESLFNVTTMAKECEADIILTTQKDWVKIALLAKNTFDIEFAFVAIELMITKNKDEITNLIDETLK